MLSVTYCAHDTLVIQDHGQFPSVTGCDICDSFLMVDRPWSVVSSMIGCDALSIGYIVDVNRTMVTCRVGQGVTYCVHNTLMVDMVHGQ